MIEESSQTLDNSAQCARLQWLDALAQPAVQGVDHICGQVSVVADQSVEQTVVPHAVISVVVSVEVLDAVFAAVLKVVHSVRLIVKLGTLRAAVFGVADSVVLKHSEEVVVVAIVSLV